jgi:hypothetical protein
VTTRSFWDRPSDHGRASPSRHAVTYLGLSGYPDTFAVLHDGRPVAVRLKVWRDRFETIPAGAVQSWIAFLEVDRDTPDVRLQLKAFLSLFDHPEHLTSQPTGTQHV